MGFQRRRLAANQRKGDRELIEQYILGAMTQDDIEQKSPLLSFAMLSDGTEAHRIAAKLWKQHAPKLLRRCERRGAIPEHLATMVGTHGWPDGDWTALKSLLERQIQETTNELRARAKR